ncbi:MAG: hypothetical protein ACKOPE_01030 [Novosphingobium sp.]
MTLFARCMAYSLYALASVGFFAAANILSVALFDNPSCVRETAGCVGADWWKPYHGVIALIVGTVVPMAGFIPFRRWIRRHIGDGEPRIWDKN